MTIKQQGGVFGRNPTFNDVEIDGTLDVAGSVTTGAQTIDGTIEASKVDDAAGIFRRENSNGVAVQIYKDTNEAGRLGVFGTNDLWIGNNTCGIAFSDGLSSIYPVTTVGAGAGSPGTLDLGYSGVGFRDIYLAGNVVIGTSGKGIDFSATSGTGTSELFDDYEEGTFTPTIADAASGGNIGSATTAAGHYVKVGRVVTVAVDLVNIDTTGLTSGNYLFIGGLPFTAFSGSGSPAWTGSVLGANTWTSITTGIVSNILENTDYVRFIKDTDAATGAYLTVGDVNSGATDARFSITYFAA
jgi:hypothetical protein